MTPACSQLTGRGHSFVGGIRYKVSDKSNYVSSFGKNKYMHLCLICLRLIVNHLKVNLWGFWTATLQIAPGLKALSLAPSIRETTGELSWVKLLAVDAVDASDFLCLVSA